MRYATDAQRRVRMRPRRWDDCPARRGRTVCFEPGFIAALPAGRIRLGTGLPGEANGRLRAAPAGKGGAVLQWGPDERVQAFKHAIPDKPMQPEVRSALHILKAKPEAAAADPAHLCAVHGKGVRLVRKKEAKAKPLGIGDGSPALQRATADRKARHGSFTDHGVIGEHGWVAAGQTIMSAHIRAY